MVGGWGMGWGVVGGYPYTCAHARMHTHAHACMVNMIISCKWLPPLDLAKSRGFPMMSYMHAHAQEKTGKKFFEGHWSTFCIKMPVGIGHPPPTHQLQSTCVREGARVPNLQNGIQLSRFVQKLWHF